MEANEQLIQVNEFSRPGVIRSYTRNVVWHFTANPGASSRNHYIYFGKTMIEQNLRIIEEANKLTGAAREEMLKKVRYASANTFIDPIETLTIIPLDEESWHASQANPYSVGVELCIEKDGTFHPDTVKQAIEFGAYLAKKYNLDPLRDFIRHYDVTGKICPKPWVDNSEAWEKFKQDVSDKMNNKGGSRILELKDWQWTMLGDALTELSKVGGGVSGDKQLLSYEWAEKAYKRELSVDETLWLMTIAFARSKGLEVEAR